MYTDIAEWWPLLSRPEDYEEEATFYLRTLEQALGGPPKTVLELGSGGGNNASFMKKRTSITLVDMSPEMLAVSRGLNPECEHIEGDMRRVRLGREFDVVFVHDAIVYMTSRDDLAAAVETAFVHTRPGGIALFCPDHTKDNFTPRTDHGGYDDGVRGLRYLEWSWDPDPSDVTCITDYVYLIRDSDGGVQVLHDRHVEGLFSEEEWVGVLEGAGFAASVVPFLHTEVPEGATLFLGRKRSP
jgi:SAM-dependent methyltransferase